MSTIGVKEKSKGVNSSMTEKKGTNKGGESGECAQGKKGKKVVGKVGTLRSIKLCALGASKGGGNNLGGKFSQSNEKTFWMVEVRWLEGKGRVRIHDQFIYTKNKTNIKKKETGTMKNFGKTSNEGGGLEKGKREDRKKSHCLAVRLGNTYWKKDL